MKKNILIFVITVVVLSFVTVQCTKDNLQKFSNDNNELIQRSDNLNENLQGASLSEGFCYDPPSGCDFDFIDTFIYMPFYYNDTLLCDSLRVRIRTYIYHCDDNSIYFDNFIADAVDTAGLCGEFNMLLSALASAGNYDEISRLLDMLEYQASLIFEKEYVKDILLGLGIECPDYYITSYYYKNKCYQWCAEIVSKPGDKYIVENVSKVFCGNKCCERTVKHCIKGGILYSSDPIFLEVGNGQCGTIPIGNCNGTFLGECDRVCGEP